MVNTYYSLKPKNRFTRLLGEVFSNKRIRGLAYIIVLLWVAVGAQFIVNRFFVPEGNIMQAFVNTNSGLMESTLEITATYGSGYLTEEDKKSLIAYITTNLGIQVNSDIEVISEENRQEFVFKKQAKRAHTSIKLVSLYGEDSTEAFVKSSDTKDNVNHYLVIRLTIYEDVSNDILIYEEKLRDLLKGLNINTKGINTTLQFSGSFVGQLALDTKNKIADRMIKSLKGEVVFENRQDNLYTIYAYTGLLSEYITVDKNKINIQVAMTYEEDNDRTKIYLATPIISGDW